MHAMYFLKIDIANLLTISLIGFLMQKIMHGKESLSETNQFRKLWHDRVAKILLKHQDDPQVIKFI